MQKATTADLKKANMKRILQHIYRQKKTSKLDIATQLELSRPTVNQCVKELEDMRLVEKNGYFESTGGRKADAITFIASSKMAIGVELLKDQFEIVAVNLYGDILRSAQHPLPFRHSDAYYGQVCDAVNQFISQLRVNSKRILGVGIVLQGLISSDGRQVTYGKILDCTGLTVDSFSRQIPYTCRMFHDAESAAVDELWDNRHIKDAIFFHIRTNLSGAIIVDGNFLQGNELKSGVFEHMTIVPDGRPCYCGKRGCMDCYCSYPYLLEPGETLDAFFSKLRDGDQAARQTWQEYLQFLAIGIDNMHMLIDYDIVLGGTLAKYLQPPDIAVLHKMVYERSAFPTARQFIQISSSASTPISKGAALPYIKQYLNTVIEPSDGIIL